MVFKSQASRRMLNIWFENLKTAYENEKYHFRNVTFQFSVFTKERIILARMMRITAAIEGDIKDCREKILLPFADDLTAEIK